MLPPSELLFERQHLDKRGSKPPRRWRLTLPIARGSQPPAAAPAVVLSSARSPDFGVGPRCTLEDDFVAVQSL